MATSSDYLCDSEAYKTHSLSLSSKIYSALPAFLWATPPTLPRDTSTKIHFLVLDYYISCHKYQLLYTKYIIKEQDMSCKHNNKKSVVTTYRVSHFPGAYILKCQ